VAGLKVPAGDYTLFVDISDPDNWVMIVNKQTGQWGLRYDKTQEPGPGEDDHEQAASRWWRT